jgi:hypothetical protein
VLGVVVALFVVGMFTTRATPWAAFIAMISGVGFAVCLDIFTTISFTYIGTFSFLYTIVAGYLFSLMERPVPREKLVNLTIHTLPDAKAPWVGLASWAALWKWAVLIAVSWFSFSVVWEWYMRTH